MRTPDPVSIHASMIPEMQRRPTMRIAVRLYLLLMMAIGQPVVAFTPRQSLRDTAGPIPAASSKSADDPKDSSDTDGLLSLGSKEEAQALLKEAEKIRQEVDVMRRKIEIEKEAKRLAELDKVDAWIDKLLVAQRKDDTELLYSVEQATQLLVDLHVTEEHILKIFRRLSDLGNAATRDNCSPIVELLVEASGRMDCIDREEQSNKRWSGKVERKLRQRLFAREYGIEIDDLDEEERRGRG